MSEKILDFYKKRARIFWLLYLGGIAVGTITLLLVSLVWDTGQEAGIFGDIAFGITAGGMFTTVVSLYLGLFWYTEEVGNEIAEAYKRQITEIIKRTSESVQSEKEKK